ncbi:AOC03_06830 family ribosome hibernation factor [Vaginella massiliensis]|uniref:AOC03_06830 family ribosome hibernation factor n=1 Tax=Vaginella massiliensis TaxID=1816680 RepID=UPI0008389F4E|nr:hypothetical protein [Vaginella massiliensis]
MEIKLKSLKNLRSENSITIILNTHRTLPDNKQDALLLKNLVKEAENRLLADFSSKEVKDLIEKLHTLADSIDHRHNLESLILFVSREIAEYVRLPIPVENRVVIDNTFATRDLIRGMHHRANYYVLVLSKDEARLIQASEDKVVKEFGGVFPYKNELAQAPYKAEASDASRLSNLTAEFFNQVDKAVNYARKDNPLPVLVVSDEQNYHEYLKIADQPNTIFETSLGRSRQTEKDAAIVADAWKIVRKHNEEKNNQRKEELLKAVSSNKFLSDTNEIYQAIKQGKMQTLFIEQGLFQPAVIENDEVVLVSDDQRNDKDVIDDIYDELIELNMDFGGDVVFLPKGELKDFNGFAGITRY